MMLENAKQRSRQKDEKLERENLDDATKEQYKEVDKKRHTEKRGNLSDVEKKQNKDVDKEARKMQSKEVDRMNYYYYY